MALKYINLNDYTLLEDSSKGTIYFYPESSIINQKVQSTKDTLRIKFDIFKEDQNEFYTMYVSLINSDNEELYQSYSIYLKELSLYKYVILNGVNDYKDAELLPSLIIDFNKLNYNNFLNILANNKELSKMIPSLKSSLEADIKELAEAKNIAEVLDVQSPINYYQNVTGNLINRIEKMIGNAEEEEISNRILKNFKKNYELAIKEPRQEQLSFLSILAGLYIKVKSSTLSPKNIVDVKDLKADTNKEEIKYQDLVKILDFLVEREKSKRPIPEDLNIIQERIVYLIETKPKIKSFQNLLKVILFKDEYMKKGARVRAIDESKLKELLLKDLNELSYRLLPRNQVLLFNKNEDIVDFIAILSIDKIISLMQTYHVNRNSNPEMLALFKKVTDIIENQKYEKDNDYLKLLIINTLKTSVYYYENVSKTILLFNTGESVINLGYIEGEYDISVINRKSDKKLATFNKLTDEIKEEIKENLNKSEKSFISYINNLVFDNLFLSLINFNLEINIKELSHEGITIKINKSRSSNSFNGEFTLEELLLPLSEVKQLRVKPVKEEPKEEVEVDLVPKEEEVEVDENALTPEEIDQIIRKASAIAEVMNTKPVDNNDYKIIAELYNEYRKTKNEDLLPTLKDALDKESTSK